MSAEIKQELKEYLTRYDDSYFSRYGFQCNGRQVYKNLFTEPVKQLFYWQEEDWQGSTFAVYEYKNHFVVVGGYFGSCSGCDAFEGISTCEDISNILNKQVNDAEIHKNIMNIELSKYSHPELCEKFDKFRDEFVKSNLLVYM